MYGSTLSLTLVVIGGGLCTPRQCCFADAKEAEWAPGPVWTRSENFALPRFDPQAVSLLASRYTD